MTPDVPARPDSPEGSSPLSPTQLDQLSTAIQRTSKIRGAARAASVTGWATVALGLSSFLLTLFSPAGILVGGILVAVGWNEFQGRKQVLRFDVRGPRRLARNQLWLLAVAATYLGWAFYQVRFNPDPDVTQLEELLGLGQGLVTGAMEAFYALVFVVVALFQWGMYRYHAARISLMQAYVSETPPWIVQIQRILLGK